MQDIDIDTVTLATAEGFVRAESNLKYGFVQSPEIKDCDGNGLPELMVKFDRQLLVDIVEVGNQVITVSGIAGGVPFFGQTAIRVR